MPSEGTDEPQCLGIDIANCVDSRSTSFKSLKFVVEKVGKSRSRTDSHYMDRFM